MVPDLHPPRLSLRQRIAARTPPGLRKLARMALNYPYRIWIWLGALAAFRPVDWRSRGILWSSAASALVTSFRNLDAFQKPTPLAALAGAPAVLVRTSSAVFESNDRDALIFDLLSAPGFLAEHLEGSDFLAQRAAP